MMEPGNDLGHLVIGVFVFGLLAGASLVVVGLGIAQLIGVL